MDEIVPGVERLEIATGDIIFKEGDPGYDFYIIDSGQVEIFRQNSKGQRMTIDVLEEGEAFGEFALLSQAPRSATARALSDCVVIKISEQGYQEMMLKLPSWAVSMMKAFVYRLKKMNESYANPEQFFQKK